MKYLAWMLAIAVFTTTGCTMLDDASAGTGELATETDLCEVVGLGELIDGDTFDGAFGDALDGTIAGSWEHFTPLREDGVVCEDDDRQRRGHGHGHRNHDRDGDGYCDAHFCRDGNQGVGHVCEPVCEPNYVNDHFVATATAMNCRVNGASLVDVEGTGTWNGEPGYSYLLHLEDSGGVDVDFYRLTITAPDSTLTYFVSGDLTSGDIGITL